MVMMSILTLCLACLHEVHAMSDTLPAARRFRLRPFSPPLPEAPPASPLVPLLPLVPPVALSLGSLKEDDAEESSC